ncbi:MAG: nitroreductase family protein [Candidatus Delongbacteria bacterium]|nr:nitroreductase family protein [bacterium]MBL7033144.1 nitroreductase family protein [Candidatus Delongbacteria bacterium]
MSVFELMKKRCSVREFTDQPVEEEKLIRILEAARVAPSAANRQPWHFIVLRNQALKEQVSSHWGAKAPVIIVICGDHISSWHRKDGKDHCDIDAAIAVDHMTLMITELELGSCWVCAFNNIRTAEVLDLPEQLEPIALLPLGYPAEFSDPDRHDSQRKPLEDIVSWDGYKKG